jgi:hypothetical protein
MRQHFRGVKLQARRRFAMFHKDRSKVEEHTKRNEQEILASETCGCLSCSATLAPEEVTQWNDEIDADHPERHVDRTAICPHCGDALLVGDKSGYHITGAFLDAMRMH